MNGFAKALGVYMFGPVATRFFLTAGRGDASTELNAFDAALLDAKVGDTNLVKMSSILPPSCRQIEPYELTKGSFVPVAYGAMTFAEPGRVISAGGGGRYSGGSGCSRLDHGIYVYRPAPGL